MQRTECSSYWVIISWREEVFFFFFGDMTDMGGRVATATLDQKYFYQQIHLLIHMKNF